MCVPVDQYPDQNVMLVDSLNYQNPRELPKDPNQLLLDRLGGTIRFSEVIGENLDLNTLVSKCHDILVSERKRKIGFTVLGTHQKTVLNQLIKHTKAESVAGDHNWRVENHQGKNLNSGQIFERRLLQKGIEFVVLEQPDETFILAQTVANQNLRNYDLRDRKKPWRDSKMGMLPPRLAQILINLASPKLTDLIIDPFCGSGTVCGEAAILGNPTQGSDLNPDFIAGAQENFQFLSEKFRFKPESGKFLTSDVRDLDWENLSGVVATEGWLGENFEKRPSRNTINENADKIVQLWQQVFEKLENSGITSLVFCVPAWNFHSEKISISDQVLSAAEKHGYKSTRPFGGQDTFIYEREGAFVGREICVVRKD